MPSHRQILSYRPKVKQEEEDEEEKPETRPRVPKATTSQRQDFMDDDDPDIDQLLHSVLDGIGRMHVAMDQDDAGRWRIKRTGEPSD
jgi:hypothetical protein